MGAERDAFAADVRRARADAGLSLHALATAAHTSRGYLHHVEHGRRWPSRAIVVALDRALGTGGALVDRWADADRRRDAPAPAPAPDADAVEALELARRATASDLGGGTLERLEQVVDDLAVAYPVTEPVQLLGAVRTHLGYVGRLAAGRTTLRQHRRLLVAGGWLSLLAATLHIDLRNDRAAGQWLRTTEDLAVETGHDELRAWRFETEAWALLTGGDHRAAVDLARAAQELAPRGSSVAVQATAQEGRAQARLGDAAATFAAITRVQALAGALPLPARPGHHYCYDPTKALAYTATTLAWVGDPAAEAAARATLDQLGAGAPARWPRRAATARLDLALALLGTDQLDEAAHSARTALMSGAVAPSNRWRALEVVTAVEARGLPEASELRETYEATGPGT